MTRLALLLMLVGMARGETVPAMPVASIKLALLDMKAEENLGKRMTFDAKLAKDPVIAGNQLAVTTPDGKPVNNLVLLLSAKLVPQVKAFESTADAAVFITGAVVAPARPNAPFGFEIEEIKLYNPNGQLLKTINASSATVKIPESESKLEVTASVKPLGEEAPDARSEFSMETMAAAGLAAGVGVAMLILLMKRRRSRKPSEPLPPPTSVSDRLNRRVR